MSRVWYLAARKLSDDISLEELQELEQILQQHPELASQLEVHSRYFIANGALPGQPDSETIDAWSKVKNAINSSKEEDEFLKPATAARGKRKAVVKGILISCLLLLSLWVFYEKSNEKVAAKIESNDSKYDVTLPDGSKVTLNKNSRIYISNGFGKTNRNVTLEGEAYFQVAHNAGIPFIVSANSVQVKVLGTVFNVRAYKDENEVETSLVKGSVEITDVINNNLNVILKPNEKVTVQMENKEAANKKIDAAYKMETLKVERMTGIIPELAWTEDRLIFNEEPFGEVVKRFEKWYSVTIRVADDALNKELFTAVFHGESIDQALTALQVTYPFKFHREKDGDIVIEK